jgi:hypothetical protein
MSVVQLLDNERLKLYKYFSDNEQSAISASSSVLVMIFVLSGQFIAEIYHELPTNE